MYKVDLCKYRYVTKVNSEERYKVDLYELMMDVMKIGKKLYEKFKPILCAKYTKRSPFG